MLNKKLKANCCWISDPVKQRLTHVYFRREFSLDLIPEQAVLHLFANTIYQLFVNGKFIGTGPARSYPEFPEYDTYELQDFLQPGTNVIAVNIAHHGIATFHHLLAPGFFTAVGQIGNIDLDSPGEWQCRKSNGYHKNPHRFSFAIGPVQTFDARKENGDWKHADSPSGNWQAPVKVKIQEPLNFVPRSIPHLTNDEILPTELMSANYHDEKEQFYTLSILSKFNSATPQPPSQRAFVYSYIHSPEKQSVAFGCWWGEYFLNGKRVTVDYDKSINFRQQGTMDLEEGWNFFLFSVGTVKDICELQLTIPISAKLVFAADHDKDSQVPFRVTEPMDENKAQSILCQLPGKKLEKIRELKEHWRDYCPPEIPEADIKYLSWIRFGESLNLLKNKLENIEIPAGRNCTMIFDMGQILLGRVFVEYDAPENTIIDIGYAEELFDNRPHYNKNHLVGSAERQICAAGIGRIETFAPRGLRYLQITVTNHDAPVIIKKIGMMSQIYPYIRKGAFSCSDEKFNKLYEWGWHTLELCSEDVITDCPWRERTLYGGDLLPEAATALVMTGDLRLVKRCIEVFLQSQNEDTGWLQSMAPMRRDRAPLFDYPPLVLLNAEWYCRLTGDAEFAERAYPVFKNMLEYALSIRNEEGLFSASNVFIEHGYPIKDGVVTAFNALMVKTFCAWTSLLKMLDRNEEAEESLALSKDINLRIPQYLWDEKAGAFADGISDHGFSETHGIAANSWPELFANLDKEKWGKMLSHIRNLMKQFNPEEEQKTVSTYGAFYFLGALYKAGEEGFAEESIRTIYAEHLKHPTGTIWEHANPSKSLVHAWSTAPNFYFATRVLGVQLGFPETTDLSKITIAPESATLTWAKGTVPHPQGDVSVDWKIAGDKLIINYQVPEDVEVTIAPRGLLAGLELVVS